MFFSLFFYSIALPFDSFASIGTLAPISQNSNRQGLYTQNKTRQDKTRQDKTRQDKTRQDKTRQDKTRQDKTIE